MPATPAGIALRFATQFLLRAKMLSILSVFILASCNAGNAPNFKSEDDDVTPAEDSIGERLFLDTRFAQYFAAHMTGVNVPLAVGDPVVQQVYTTSGTLPGPFAGQSMNCRSCHFVTEFQGVTGAGNRTYSDFTAHSPIPLPMNGYTQTPRNSMHMVGSLQSHPGPTLLHFDGEFAAATDLVKATLTGRNFGWAPDQAQQATAQVALVVRQDDGSDQLAKDRTNRLSYSVLFAGTDSRITKDLLIPAADRIDAASATDDQILDVVAKCIATYMGDLLFQQDEFGRYIGSPYDVFIRINHLPAQPNTGESIAQYNQRLYQAVLGLSQPQWVDGSYGSFQYHANPFQFGSTEFAGLKIFLNAVANATDGSQHAGNCGACHAAPNFSDFSFHNTGVSQEEYDAAHGSGAFSKLSVPNLSDRDANYDLYLPATAAHPNASETFRRAADANHPGYADLGLWNIYLNPDMPNPQSNLKAIVCATGQDCSIDQGLAKTLGQFKTPVLRDLEDSGPYFHNGGKLSLNDVVTFYINSSTLAHQGLLRNPPAEFRSMSLSQDDVNALVAFLLSLTEDYDDA
jgi:cytochrome c peroxidase